MVGATTLGSAAAALSPVPKRSFGDQVVSAGHGLERLGAHGRFGGEAGWTAQHGEGDADAGGSVRLEQRVGVESGGVEPLGRAPPSQSRILSGAVTFAQCRSEWAAQRVTAGAGMPTNSGIARSMYCSRTATRSVSTADSVPARSAHQESGSWRSCSPLGPG
ncbi:hypothetical protein [Streptomyces sp. SP18BB07]|uniref:hypothetical protein n=1 Tax=Streptomyces sp. SP18BB07 TaxID=3002522 RepID=UPI002E78FB07|nr:hypothetical protein [Streptomyces sp. SP18BB07]